MKVISQLIRHFWERGVLSSEEVEYLVQHGFARRHDVPGYRFPQVDEPTDIAINDFPALDNPDEFDRFEESLVRRQDTRRTGHEPHPAQLKIEEILHRVHGEFERREISF